jgi:hypothetical protein
LAGSFPFIVFNIVTLGEPFRGHHHPLTQVFAGIPLKMGILLSTLNGTAVYGLTQGHAIESHGVGGWLSILDATQTLLPYFVVAGAVILIVVAGPARFPRLRSARFILLVTFFIQLAILLTLEATGTHHVIMVYPFVQVLVAYTLCAVVYAARSWDLWSRRIGKSLIVTLGILLMATNVSVDFKYIETFATEGGHGNWTDSIYDLAAFAEGNPDRQFVMMDWGMFTQLLTLSRGSIKMEEPGWMMADPAHSDEKAEGLALAASDPRTIFVFHAEPAEIFREPRNAFNRMLIRHHLLPKPLMTFREHGGKPIYELIICEPEPLAADTK